MLKQITRGIRKELTGLIKGYPDYKITQRRPWYHGGGFDKIDDYELILTHHSGNRLKHIVTVVISPDKIMVLWQDQSFIPWDLLKSSGGCTHIVCNYENPEVFDKICGCVMKTISYLVSDTA